jgi:hypothetical protein
VAIKGKAKRSQGRPVRRVTPGPRPVAVERRLPWYRTSVFMVMVAVLALALTVVAAGLRARQGWERDDVERFTKALAGPVGKVTAITGAGTSDHPGFTTATDLNTGKIKPAELNRRAQNWNVALGAARQEVAAVRVGDPEVKLTPDGVPTNDVGSRVMALTGIRDSYAAAVDGYTAAANLFVLASRLPAAEREQTVKSAQETAQAATTAMDAAASALATVRGSFGMDVSAQLPGESSTGYGTRLGSSPAGSPGLSTNG